jgi:hypothetical protein
MVKKSYDRIKNSFRMNRSFNILHNRFILYFLLFLSTVYLVCCGLVGEFLLPTFFILIGIITSFFSKNMTVILTIALVSSNILRLVIKGSFHEGFENDEMEKGKSDKKEENGEDKSDIKDASVLNKKEETSVKKPKINEANIGGMQDKYKELMALQDTILGQLGNLEESLVSAENVVDKIVRTVKS